MADGPAMPFPPSRRDAAPGAGPPRPPPPRRRSAADLDPVPFPGGAEAALEFAAYEKGLLEHGGNRGQAPARHAPPAIQRAPTSRHAPLSQPDRHRVRWRLAGAGLALAAATLFLLLSSGLLAAGLSTVLRTVVPF